MKARLQTAIDHLAAFNAGNADALGHLQVALNQALAEAVDPPAIPPVDAQLQALVDGQAELLERVNAIADAAGV